MAFEMSDTVQTVQIYNITHDTGELIERVDVIIPPNTGLPADSTTLEPPVIPDEHVAIFINETWSVVEDHRGQTVYETRTGNAVTIKSLGPLPDDVVLTGPEESFMKWDGNGWVEDTDAKKAIAIISATENKNRRLSEAANAIAPLQDAVDLKDASDSEKKLLIEWKKYRVAINRVDVNSAPDITWPDIPA